MEEISSQQTLEQLADKVIEQETQIVTHIYRDEIPAVSPISQKYTEISMVIEGAGIHRIMNTVCDCSVGDLYIINSDIPHEYFAKSETEYPTIRTLRFKATDFFEGDLCDENSAGYCFGVFRNNHSVSYATLTARTMQQLEYFLDSIENEIQEKGISWQEAVKSYLSLLLILASRYINVANIVKSEHTKDWLIVSSVIRMVAEQYGDADMTLETLAASFYISKSHLSRLFRRTTGEYFQDYIKKVRIRRACELLLETSMTNTMIVNQCGLKDVPSFYRLFKSVMGTTPYQYRMAQQTNYHTEQKGEKAMIIQQISENIQNGKAKIVKELVQKAIDSDIPVSRILNEGLLGGMNVVGEQFKANEIYVPEVLISARAMNMGMEILKPYLGDDGMTSRGKVCIGSVQGDLHDIGKNLVKMMMEGKGLEVIDLGVDVSPETFVKTAIEQNCSVICCSSLLTTTMDSMGDVVKEAEKAGIRDKVKIMIGGAPISEAFCQKIGADCYTPDAASAADAAVELCAAMEQNA